MSNANPKTTPKPIMVVFLMEITSFSLPFSASSGEALDL
jgi:hypothetical protein